MTTPPRPAPPTPGPKPPPPPGEGRGGGARNDHPALSSPAQRRQASPLSLRGRTRKKGTQHLRPTQPLAQGQRREANPLALTTSPSRVLRQRCHADAVFFHDGQVSRPLPRCGQGRHDLAGQRRRGGRHDAKQDDAARCRQPVSKRELPEILVEGNHDAVLGLGTGEDFSIFAPGGYGANPDHVVPRPLERAAVATGTFSSARSCIRPTADRPVRRAEARWRTPSTLGDPHG